MADGEEDQVGREAGWLRVHGKGRRGRSRLAAIGYSDLLGELYDFEFKEHCQEARCAQRMVKTKSRNDDLVALEQSEDPEPRAQTKERQEQ